MTTTNNDDDDEQPPIWLTSLEALQLSLNEDRKEDALRECLSLLLKQPTLPQSIRKDVKIIQSKIFLHLENYKQIKKNNGIGMYSYVLYRQKKYKDALEETNQTTTTENSKDNDDLLLTRHVRAQSNYRCHQLKDALLEYKQIILDDDEKKQDDDDEERIEILTNALAIVIANMIPGVDNDDDDLDWLLESAKDTLKKKQDKDNLFYDLAYNLGTFQLLLSKGDDDDDDWLSLALEACQEQTDSDPKEMAPILVNQSLLSSTTFDDIKKDDDMPDAVKTVLKLSSSKASYSMYSGSLPSDVVFATQLQRTIWWYNKAVLALKVNKYSECKQSLDKLLQGIIGNSTNNNNSGSGNNKGGRKKGNKSTTTTTTIDPSTYTPKMVWWIAQCAIVEAYLQLKQQQKNKGSATTATKVFMDCLGKIKQAPTSHAKDEALTMLQLQLGAIQQQEGDDDDDKSTTIQILSSLPDSTKERAGVAARLEYLSSDKKDPMAIATNLLREEKYNQVVELLKPFVVVQKEKTKNQDEKDHQIRVLYWQALSQTFENEPTAKAMNEWKSLGLDEIIPVLDDVELNVDEMEQRPLPRSAGGRGKKKKATATTTTSLTTTTTKKRSKESILRRRAKLRDEYLEKLKKKGRNIATKPDPERWLPKYERSSNRRRGRGTHVGSQGGIAERDALKLDVAARKKGGVTTSFGPSTANLSVAGGQVKRGKKKR